MGVAARGGGGVDPQWLAAVSAEAREWAESDVIGIMDPMRMTGARVFLGGEEFVVTHVEATISHDGILGAQIDLTPLVKHIQMSLVIEAPMCLPEAVDPEGPWIAA